MMTCLEINLMKGVQYLGVPGWLSRFSMISAQVMVSRVMGSGSALTGESA